VADPAGTVLGYLKLWESSDWGRLAEFVGEPALSQLRGAVRRDPFRDYRITVDELSTEGDLVTVTMTMECVHAASGRATTATGTKTYRVKRRRITAILA
jgi:hypothetical protein